MHAATNDATTNDAPNDTTTTTDLSPVVAAMEAAWRAICGRHPEIPGVAIVIYSGKTGKKYDRNGHFWSERWAVREGAGRVGEVMLAGEHLREGAAAVFTTLLHEAAHALAAVRKIKDTSRQGRFHNGRYRALAQELGLDVAQGCMGAEGASAKNVKTYGWCRTTLPDAAAAVYAAQIAAIDAALHLYRVLPGDEPAKPKPAVAKATLICAACEVALPPMRTKQAESLQAFIRCTCGGEFTIEADPDSDDAGADDAAGDDVLG